MVEVDLFDLRTGQSIIIIIAFNLKININYCVRKTIPVEFR